MNGRIELPAESLRAELKAWEKAFSDKHEGRKATRDEIKQHPEIGLSIYLYQCYFLTNFSTAQKYKLYNKLRSRVSDAARPTPSSSPPPSKRRKSSPPAQKPAPHPQTHPSTLDPYDTPRKSSDIHPTPINHGRERVGPTPQKNGVAIGLFDFLSPESASKKADTPSQRPVRIDLSAQKIAATPSKRPVAETKVIGFGGPSLSQKSLLDSIHHPSRTPQSVSKRNYLSQFMAASTPSRLHGSTPRTPSSRLRRGSGAVSKLIFGETPEYLKRDSQHAFSLMTTKENKSRPGTVEEEVLGEEIPGKDSVKPLEWSPIAVRLPRKPMGRTLSSLVQTLREAQEEELDAELDVLREIENGPSIASKLKRPKLLVRDSQVQEAMPLGPEDLGFESMGDELEEDEKGEDQGGNRKVWKKKGQKRTTRRVIMRPVVSKWKPEKEWQGPTEDEDAKVEESQVVEIGNEGGDGSGSEFGGGGSDSDEDTAEVRQGKNVPKVPVILESKDKIKDLAPKSGNKKGRPTGRTQPQNFRALKMRNKGGANGTGKAKSKFGKGGFRRR